VKTLVGDYVERGANHGRKVYQKLDKTGQQLAEVFLYYWDSRDGSNFEGWWFGNKIGGTQVWSHCKESGALPPASGWKIPWDGAARPTLVVLPKAEQERQEIEAKVKSLTEEVSSADAATNEAVEQVKATAEETPTLEGLAKAEKLLGPCVNPLNEAHKKVTDAQKNATGDAATALSQMAATIKAAH